MLSDTWVDRELIPLGNEVVLDDDGFRSRFGAAGQLPLTAVTRGHSLAILGEPGIGKSRALRQLAAGERNATYIALETVSDVQDLHDRFDHIGHDDEVFGEDDEVSGEIENRTIILDGIDECPIPTRTLVHHLLRELRPRSEARILLGCRTADWPTTLHEQLTQLQPAFRVFELLPLGRADIIDLAGAQGVDADAFLQAVTEKGAAPLASLPFTLDLLLATYSATGQLAADAADLFEQGLLHLAEEPNTDRPATKRPVGNAPQRLAVAAKLSAYALLCGRARIARRSPADGDELLAGLMSAGTETLDGGNFAITDALVDSTLETALFTGHGHDRFAVAHASIAAYLTARYLHDHGLSETQVRALLTRTSSLGRNRVPSRLREAAAWLVALDAVRYSWLVDVDPESLATHAGLVDDSSVRQRLVDHLLASPVPHLLTGRRRWRLAHEGLAEQLRTAIRAPLTTDAGPDFGHPVSQRAWVAIEIARAAGARDSVPDLVDLVLEPSANPYLRAEAAYALLDLDPVVGARALREVLNEVSASPECDPDDELRGLALRANWPDSLTATELVQFLSRPQSSNFIGSYALFINHFLDEVSDQVASTLVREVADPNGTNLTPWLDEDETAPLAESSEPTLLLRGPHRDGSVMTALLRRVLDSTTLPDVIDDVSALLAQAVSNHRTGHFNCQRLGGADRTENKDLRRRLFLATCRRLPEDHGPLLLHRTLGLLDASDLDWLFSLEGTEDQGRASRLVRWLFDPSDPKQQEVAWGHEGSEIFNTSVRSSFEAVELGSAREAEMREAYEWSSVEPRTWDGYETHDASIRAAWERCQDGDPGAFIELCRLLRIDPGNGQSSIGHDMRTWPSFRLLETTEGSLQAACSMYLRNCDPGPESWFDTLERLPHRQAFAFAALYFIASSDPEGEHSAKIAPETWERWMPAVVRFTETSDSDPFCNRLRSDALMQAPAPFREWLVRSVEVRARANWHLGALNSLSDVWDNTVADRVAGALRTAISYLEQALDALAVKQAGARETPSTDRSGTIQGARENADRLAHFLAPRHAATRVELRAIASASGAHPVGLRAMAAGALLATGQLEWEPALSWMEQDEDFGVALAQRLAASRRSAALFGGASPSELADLWLWTEERWSTTSDYLVDGPVLDDYHVRELRNDIVVELQMRGTAEALATLSTLSNERPDDYRLKTALVDAESREYDAQALGLAPAELTALIGNRDLALVNDDDSLYRAILASIDRFAARMLQIGQVLWNETRSLADPNAKIWSPKFEADISALVHDHLAQEFRASLVVNREVQVRQTSSKGHGLAVDVLPTSTSAGTESRLPNCPVEIKGNWNPDLMTDIERQLVDDYLPAADATRGIYFCAWFPTDQWTDQGDPRWARAARRDRARVERDLQAAAHRASVRTGKEVTAVIVEIPRPHSSKRVT